MYIEHTRHYHNTKGDNRQTVGPHIRSEPHITYHSNSHILNKQIIPTPCMLQLLRVSKLQQCKKEDLKLCLIFLTWTSSNGFSINNIVCENLTVVIHSDAYEYCIGGYSTKFMTWRLLILEIFMVDSHST